MFPNKLLSYQKIYLIIKNLSLPLCCSSLTRLQKTENQRNMHKDNSWAWIFRLR